MCNYLRLPLLALGGELKIVKLFGNRFLVPLELNPF